MLTLECTYSKKIGLPGYSSHQFCVTLRAEIPDVSQVQSESARLYALLQQGVDASIQQVGFLPNENGRNATPRHYAGNGANGHHSNGHSHAESWTCTPKQKDLILSFVDEQKLDKVEADNLAQDMFGKGVRQLNKLEASGLIDELIEKYGTKGNRRFSGGRR